MRSCHNSLLGWFLIFMMVSIIELPAQEDSLTVKFFKIIGLEKISEEEIYKLIKSRKDAPFNEVEWSADKTRLLESGLFEEVDLVARKRSDYVSLTLTVKEKKHSNIVLSIEIEGLKQINKAQLLAFIKTQKGLPYDAKQFDGDILRLHKLNFISDVKADVNQTVAGVTIKLYIPEERDWFDRLKFRTEDGTSNGLAKYLSEQIRMKNEYGQYFDSAQIEMLKRRVKEFYKTKSFYWADVQASVVLQGSEKRLLLNVRKGPRMRVGSFEFFGNKEFSDRELILKSGLNHRPYLKYLQKTKYDESKFEEDKIRLQQFYHQSGYIDANVTFREFEYSANLDRVYITADVSEGPRYYVRKVSFKGNTVFTDEEIYTQLKLVPGDFYFQNATYQDAKAIEALYGSDARLFTVVAPKILFDLERNLVELVYEIRESKKISIGKVIVRGNDITYETVYLRELELFPGDEYDRLKFDRSKRNLQRLAFVEPEQLKINIVPSEEENVGDMIIEVAERDSGNLQFGASLSDSSDFALHGSISERNFNWKGLFGQGGLRGGGQTVSLSAVVGTESQRYSLSFVNPKIFDKLISFNLAAYRKDRIFREYDELRHGGSLGLGRKIFDDLWAHISYRLEKIEISDVADNAAQFIKDEEGDFLLSVIKGSLTFDKRNNFSFPTSGYVIRLSESLAEGKAIGEREFTQTQVEFSAYLPFHHTVVKSTRNRYPWFFGFNLEAVANFSYNDSTVPLSERFFTGGPSSVRGFKPNRLGPREANGAFVPGNLRVVGNFEVNVPVYLDMLYLAFFVDAGYVWPELQDFELDDIRISTGVTLRIRLPQMNYQPISLNFGVPLRDEPSDERERFSFSFITTF